MTGWTKLYLKADDKAIMLDYLHEAGLAIEENGELIVMSNENSFVAEIGGVTKGTGIIVEDSDGFAYEKHELVPGYHVNVYTQDQSVIDSLLPVTINPPPVTPYAVWNFMDASL